MPILTPYNSIPFHGVLFPTKKCGNFMGSITASFNASFALSSPATSSQLKFGSGSNIDAAIASFSSSLSAPPLVVAFMFFFEKKS